LSGTWESADPSFRTDTFMLLSCLGLIIPAAEGASSPAGEIHPAGEQQLNKYGRMRPYVIHALRTNVNARVYQSQKVCQPSCDGRPDGSLPAFAWSNVSTPIRTITARPSLCPSSLTRTVNSVPCGPPASQTALATIRAYRVPGMSHD